MSLSAIMSALPTGEVAVLAGAGFRDGVPARDAPAGWPMGVARRPDGDLIVNDYWGNRIWRIDRRGHPASVRRRRHPRDRGLTAVRSRKARFREPHDLHQDRHGNLYLSDLGNHTIRRIDYRTGIVTLVAGSGRIGRGGDGGPAVDAELDCTCGVAVDAGGNVYLSRRVGQQHPPDRRAHRDHRPVRRLRGPPLPVRARREPPVRRRRPEPDGLPRRRRPRLACRLLPSRAPGVRLARRPVRLRQLQRPHPPHRHADRHHHDGPGQRAARLQRRRRAGRGGQHADAGRDLPGRPRQPLRGREVRLPHPQGGGRQRHRHHPGRQRRAGLGRGGTARQPDGMQLRRGGDLGRPGRHRALGRLLRPPAPLRRRDRDRHDRPGRHRRRRRRGGRRRLPARPARDRRRRRRLHLLRRPLEPARAPH